MEQVSETPDCQQSAHLGAPAGSLSAAVVRLRRALPLPLAPSSGNRFPGCRGIKHRDNNELIELAQGKTPST